MLRRVDHALVGLAVPAMATALVCRVEQDAADRAAGHPAAALVVGRSSRADAAAVPTARSTTSPRRSGLRSASAGSGPASTAWRRCPRAARCCCSPTGCSSAAACRSTRAGRRSARSSAVRPTCPLDALCDRLLAEMLGEGAEDDVAVLAVRAHPVHAPRPAEAGPELVPPVVPLGVLRISRRARGS